MKNFSENIRFWRKQEGLSQEKFAQKLGINRGKLATYEESVEPRQEFLIMLADKFKVNIHYMLTRTMTEGTFDSFFLKGKMGALDTTARKKHIKILEKLMTIKSEEDEEIRHHMIDEVIVSIVRLMEENHDLREDLLELLKDIKE